MLMISIIYIALGIYSDNACVLGDNIHFVQKDILAHQQIPIAVNADNIWSQILFFLV